MRTRVSSLSVQLACSPLSGMSIDYHVPASQQPKAQHIPFLLFLKSKETSRETSRVRQRALTDHPISLNLSIIPYSSCFIMQVFHLISPPLLALFVPQKKPFLLLLFGSRVTPKACLVISKLFMNTFLLSNILLHNLIHHYEICHFSVISGAYISVIVEFRSLPSLVPRISEGSSLAHSLSLDLRHRIEPTIQQQ